MRLHTTPEIHRLCVEARHDATLPEEARDAARRAIDEETIEWGALKHIVRSIQQRRRGTGPPLLLHKLCSGGGLALPPPPLRPVGKSPELQAHLDRLRVKLEQDRYDAMVADVAAGERDAAAASARGLQTYRQQLSFGLHVVVMMGAFYLFGHLAGTAMTSNRALHPAMGLAFMVLAMLLETALYVIRTTASPQLHHAVEQRGRRARRALEHARADAAQATAGAAALGAGEGDEGKRAVTAAVAAAAAGGHTHHTGGRSLREKGD